MESTTQDQGLYILAIVLSSPKLIQAGRLPQAELRPGIYLYCGRAKKNLRARVSRHLRKLKKTFWHIDYLLPHGHIHRVWIKPGFYDECKTISQINMLFPEGQFPIKGFGASDCRCISHLVYMPYDKNHLRAIINKLNFEEVTIDEN